MNADSSYEHANMMRLFFLISAQLAHEPHCGPLRIKAVQVPACYCEFIELCWSLTLMSKGAFFYKFNALVVLYCTYVLDSDSSWQSVKVACIVKYCYF